MDQYEWVRTAHRVYKKSIRQVMFQSFCKKGVLK